MSNNSANLQQEASKLEQYMIDLRARYSRVRSSGTNRAWLMFLAMQTEKKIREINSRLGMESKEVYAGWTYD